MSLHHDLGESFRTPTFPGKTTYGMVGNRLSGPSRHTGTPGAPCPTTIARVAPRPMVPTFARGNASLADDEIGTPFDTEHDGHQRI
jgi:hypothetical protein